MKRNVKGILSKCIAVGSIIGILIIGLACISGKKNDRKNVYENAVHEIQRAAGGNVHIKGMYIAIPYVKIIYKEDFVGGVKKMLHEYETGVMKVAPEKFDVTGQFNTTIRRVGIYSAPVYKAKVHIQSEFNVFCLKETNISYDMSTHINAPDGAIAESVLLPGDPLRAKFIAEHFLEDAHCYNEVRGMYGYTGTHNGKRVSVQGTGMGQPSLSIYVTELFQFYGVQKAVRVGTCGAVQKDIQLRDVLLASGACSDSGINTQRFGTMHFAPTADFDLLEKAYHAICGGIRLLEVQQSSDVTYRLYDWGRGRECSVEKGIACIKSGSIRNVTPFPGAFSCPYFTLEEISVEQEYSGTVDKAEGKILPSDFILLFVIDGSGTINGSPAEKESLFAFEPGEKVTLTGDLHEQFVS